MRATLILDCHDLEYGHGHEGVELFEFAEDIF